MYVVVLLLCLVYLFVLLICIGLTCQHIYYLVRQYFQIDHGCIKLMIRLVKFNVYNELSSRVSQLKVTPEVTWSLLLLFNLTNWGLIWISCMLYDRDFGSVAISSVLKFNQTLNFKIQLVLKLSSTFELNIICLVW